MLFEPALTNIGIVLPDPGYHQGVRDLCTKYGTLLVIDETHTICAGPGGCTKAWDLDPDLVTIGKTLGAGVPSAAFGMTQEVATRIIDHTDWRNSDVAGPAGRSPAMRCRWPRCAPPWARCSRTRRSKGWWASASGSRRASRR